jgi:hypothetical protein
MTTIGVVFAAYGALGRYQYLVANSAAMQASIERILMHGEVHPMPIRDFVQRMEDLLQSEHKA